LLGAAGEHAVMLLTAGQATLTINVALGPLVQNFNA
jgi:hypothetical protein